jgi:hypothetical protein
MTPIPIEGPAVEPVTVSEMRGFLRLDDGAEDALVADLIRAARLQVEVLAGRVLLSSRWRLLLDRWPLGGIVTLPIGPVLAVEAVASPARAGPPPFSRRPSTISPRATPPAFWWGRGGPSRSPCWRASPSISALATACPPPTCRRR